MRILALEPYFGGSHRAFLDGWSGRSSHDWTVLSLPPIKWKWRMRHSAVEFSRQTAGAVEKGQSWDIVFCSDMLNLAEFLGLAPPSVRALPAIAYFHENQLTYPVRHEDERDYHFVFSNMTTALAARRVWFNSAYHRDSFLSALEAFLRRMPDHEPADAVERIRERADIRPPGIKKIEPRPARPEGPMRILWCARWEYDKGPDVLFAALDILADRDVPFEVSVIGGIPAGRVLPVFEKGRKKLGDRILRWGYQDTREDYLSALAQADVAVSTAQHEFFGIGMVEAAAAGAYPLVPRRLAYPEVFGASEQDGVDSFFYDGNAEQLADRLRELSDRLGNNDLWQGMPARGMRTASQYYWDNLVAGWDNDLARVASGR